MHLLSHDAHQPMSGAIEGDEFCHVPMIADWPVQGAPAISIPRPSAGRPEFGNGQFDATWRAPTTAAGTHPGHPTRQIAKSAARIRKFGHSVAGTPLLRAGVLGFTVALAKTVAFL
jgi:hypothetical protein